MASAKKCRMTNKPRTSKTLASLAGEKLATSKNPTIKKLAAGVLGNRKKK